MPRLLCIGNSLWTTLNNTSMGKVISFPYGSLLQPVPAEQATIWKADV